jgi:phosphomannomutase
MSEARVIDVALKAAIERWIAEDPDSGSVAELSSLLAQLPDSAQELRDRFSGRLVFGTAGLRGPSRAGPNGMNKAVVRATTAGLMSYLDKANISGNVVIGYDARYGSRNFALETAAVVAGAGRSALLLPRPLPTPVLAYAVQKLHTAAGVMVTASHNPATDNGYKVYLQDGIQLTSPVDKEIEQLIESVGSLKDVPLGTNIETVSEAIIESYVDNITQAIATPGVKDLNIAYTPLHGVGGELVKKVFTEADFPSLLTVPAQAEPDPDFPTVDFPNPEEPGTLDLLLFFAAENNVDIALANDPDADRCAVAIPSSNTEWRTLTGDEVGVLLADYLMWRGVTGTYITTVVSSSLLKKICQVRRFPYAETLTGFKWVMRGSSNVAFGYEEALGYSVFPQLVRDKDGISAALLIAELAALLKTKGKTLADRLDEIALEFGVYTTAQISLRTQNVAEIGSMMKNLRANIPTTLLGRPMTRVRDLLSDTLQAGDPPGIPAGVFADVVILQGTDCRVVIRPSGTEPKLKAYLEVIVPVTSQDLAGLSVARTKATDQLAALRSEISTLLAP